MTRRVIPHGTAAALDAEVLLVGEIAIDDTADELRIGDGSTVGGLPVTMPAALAATGGAALVGSKRSEASTVLRTVSDRLHDVVNVLDWIPTNLHAGIRDRSNSTALQTYIQAALDEAPLGCDLVFPQGDYRTTAAVNMTRQMNIIGYYARFQGLFATDVTSNLFNVAIETAVLGSTEARETRIQGVRMYFATGGKHTLDIQNASPLTANHEMVIESSAFSALSTSTGAAIHIHGGTDTQLHKIVNCRVENTIHLDDCADRCIVDKCNIYGNNVGVLVDVTKGAFHTLITDNVITSRDGAVFVKRGSQVFIERNQIEQVGTNAGIGLAHIAIKPSETNYASQRCVIRDNNFGGGAATVDTSIYLETDAAGVEDTLIDGNTFGRGISVYDVKIVDSGVRGTRLGPNNQWRGNRSIDGGAVVIDGSGNAGANTANPRDVSFVEDAGSQTYGVWKTISSMSAHSGVTASSNFRIRKNLDDTLSIEGYVTADGTATGGGTVLFTLPTGMWPKTSNQRLVIPTQATSGGGNGISYVVASASTGAMTVSQLSAAGDLYFSYASGMSVKGRIKYQPGV